MRRNCTIPDKLTASSSPDKLFQLWLYRGGSGEKVILLLTQSGYAGTRAELGNNANTPILVLDENVFSDR